MSPGPRPQASRSTPRPRARHWLSGSAPARFRRRPTGGTAGRRLPRSVPFGQVTPGRAGELSVIPPPSPGMQGGRDGQPAALVLVAPLRAGGADDGPVAQGRPAGVGGAGRGHDLPDPAPDARPADRADHDLRGERARPDPDSRTDA